MIKRLFAASLLALSLCGCGLVQFDVPQEGDSQVQGCSGITCVLNTFGFSNFLTMNLSQTQEWQANAAQKDKISSAKLTSLTLDVTKPAGGDMSFLKTLNFYISAQNLPKILVADGSTFPPGVSHIELNMHPEAELAPYVKADTFSLTTDVTGSQPAQDETIHAKVIVHIKL